MGRKRSTVSRSEKIREVFQRRGLDTSPAAVVQELGEQGIKVSAGLVSLVKTNLRRRSQGGGGRSSSRGRRGGAQMAVEDVLALHDLMRRLGPDNVKRLADALQE